MSFYNWPIELKYLPNLISCAGNWYKKQGLYFLYDNGIIVYIGISKKLVQRWGAHIREGVKKFTHLDFYANENMDELVALERQLIQKHRPKYNILNNPDNDTHEKRIKMRRCLSVKKVSVVVEKQLTSHFSAQSAKEFLQQLKA